MHRILKVRRREKHEEFIIPKKVSAIKLVGEIIQERVKSRKSNGPRGNLPLPPEMAEEGTPRTGVSSSHKEGGAERGGFRREMECHMFV